jgi:hypothetical protein
MMLKLGKALCTFGALLLCSLSVVASDAGAVPKPNWPNSFVSRLEALALLETLNADLLSNNSATLTLEHWCGVHHLASPPRMVAALLPGVEKAASPQQRQELAVSLTEPVRYRHVKLLCGEVVLSEADNWYVPGRLTPEMNRLLETTDTPFGKVVQPLHFQRHTLSAKVLWFPLPEGWEMNPAAIKDDAGALAMPATLLEHRAVLTLPDGTPVSEVVEAYTNNVLAFPAPIP